MDNLVLEIFPQGSLASSVITTIWVGVCIVAYFNLRLGWVLSGLVVPGYLVPLLLIKPWSTGVIILEAVVTYVIVWFYSEKLSGWAGFTNYFGRDRFFALLVVSVLVRLLVDILFLPFLGEYLQQTYQIAFDYQNNFHSFGLIIVALIANQLWKPGLYRGMTVLLVTVGLTFCVVRFLLMEYTNFSAGNLAYMYENLAASMESGPKAYIIILTTAYIASHFNLKYGWEYNGIVVPALLALIWYHPFKLMISVGETFIVLFISSMLLRLPIFKKTTMEGARKILLFFNVCFIYKILLGHAIIRFFPEYRLTDLYGFGYLLTTLLAIKMYDKEIAIRATRTTLQVSLISLFVASIIGFSLTFVPNIFSAISFADKSLLVSAPVKGRHSIISVIKEDQIGLYQNLKRDSYIAPLAEEMDIFSEALHAIMAYSNGRDKDYLFEAVKLFSMVRYSLELVGDNHVYLHENSPRRGWGIYVVNLASQNRLLVETPLPLDEWGTAASGVILYVELEARALAIGGTDRQTNTDGSADVLQNHRTIFHIFQKVMGKSSILQVRGQTATSLRKMEGIRKGADGNDADIASKLWIRSKVPVALDLKKLRNFIGPYEVRWGNSPLHNLLRDSTEARFAEFFLSRKDRRTLLFKPLFTKKKPLRKESVQSIVGYLQDWLLSGKTRIAPRGSGQYRPPQLEELLFFDHEILTPLVRLARISDQGYMSWNDTNRAELDAMADLAGIFGYEITLYHHKVTGQDYLILSEPAEFDHKRFWGTYVFRLGKANGHVIQVPRPLSEINVFEYGVALFDDLGAEALLIGGAHPLANRDFSADLIRLDNQMNLFNLVHQVLLRENKAREMLSVQCRAFGLRETSPPLDVDVLVAFAEGLRPRQDKNVLEQILIGRLEDIGLTYKYVEGLENESGYEAGGVPQAFYLHQTQNKTFCILWLSPKARALYRQQSENTIQVKQFAAVGIPTIELDLFDVLARQNTSSALSSAELLPNNLQTAISRYIKFQDIIALQVVKNYNDFDFQRLIDVNTRQSFLIAIEKKTGWPVLAANLFPRNLKFATRIHREEISRAIIGEFVKSRAAWMLIEDSSP